MFNADDKHGQSEVIFAWFPVITKDKKIVWLSSVERIWNSLKIILF